MKAADQERGTILLAHGSRDPLWRRPLEAVAERIKQLSPQMQVRCAYLEMTAPDLATSTLELVQLGVRFITIVPMFLGIGKHSRDDIPALLGDLMVSYPHIAFNLRPAIGEEEQIIELMARIALS
jgi:sirohydrochlorin cobaltochelatase